MTPEQVKMERMMDESETIVLDRWPRFWRKLFLQLVEEGFTEEQSMELLERYIQVSTQR